VGAGNNATRLTAKENAMICPDCGYDNIEGVDWCETCGQPLVEFDPATCELEESISRHSIRVLSPKPAISVPPSCTVREAVRMMAQKNIGCLLVQEGSSVTGVFTERDVLNRISPDMTAMDRPVRDYMTRSPETIRRQDSIAYALHAMDIGGYRHMAVVDSSGAPTGILSVRDILRFLCVRFAEIRSGRT
jgi:CBS domain-containing protein